MEYKPQKKQCQNCKIEFTIESDDFSFYEKIKVPPPTFCSGCRLLRRFAYREARPLYRRICNMCNDNIVSIFTEDAPSPVFCSSCWWSDKWNASDYYLEYDFSKPFFEQFYQLQKIVPREGFSGRNTINCNYSNGSVNCKNCTLVFEGFESINCYNCQAPFFSRDSMDSNMIMNADHAYESINSDRIYNVKYIYFSDDCLDSSFLYNCVGCSNCFCCVNLRNKKYCINNIQYTKDEYQKKIKEFDLGSYKSFLSIKNNFINLYIKTPKRFARITNSVNVTGNDIQNTKNCFNCFGTRLGVENCKNIFLAALLLKDSHDASFGGDKSELFYETSGGIQSQRCLFTRAAMNSTDLEYCDRIFNCSNLFGCVHLRDKKYSILNKQYTKEKYFEMVEKIKKQMDDVPFVDRRGLIYKYGEFFPSELSLWPYNESWAYVFYPISKDEAIEKGFNWRDLEKKDHQISIEAEGLPDHIKDVDQSILNEIIGCQNRNDNSHHQCTKAFRILPYELDFLKKMNIVLPRLCPNCRFYERFRKINKPKTYNRQCMCQGSYSKDDKYKNSINHFHGDEPCSVFFETAISPDDNEIVYCEKCYQSEFI
jgi:hypothetical protein